jgi:prepilin-type N-terminal cleavage/methylation domain-containing protein
MCNITCNNQKGTSLIEVLVSIIILAIGILGVLSVFPQGWLSASKSDLLGRAGEILHQEMERAQVSIMNPCIAVSTGSTTATIYPSGGSSAMSGDVPFTVTRDISTITGMSNIWRVTVTVTWPGNSTGISESLDVTRDDNFKQGC